jgi:myo-inositol-1(or 4)-monophosphatase
MADLDLQEIHDTLMSIANDVGRMILSANPTDIDQRTKLNCKCQAKAIPP